MTLAHIIYHHEEDGWWAESPEFPSFFAAGDSFEETKELVRTELPKVAGDRRYPGLIHMVQAGDDCGSLGTPLTGWDASVTLTLTK